MAMSRKMAAHLAMAIATPRLNAGEEVSLHPEVESYDKPRETNLQGDFGAVVRQHGVKEIRNVTIGSCHAGDLFEDDRHALISDPEDLAAAKDAPCTDSPMTTGWREKAEHRLAALGLGVIPTKIKRRRFKGRGGIAKETIATCRMPAGVRGQHSEMGISEIEGEMHALIAKKDLERRGRNLRLVSGFVDHENLEAYNASVRAGPGGHAMIDQFAFTDNKMDSDEKAMDFWIPDDGHALITEVQTDSESTDSDESEMTALFKQMYEESKNDETDDLAASAWMAK